MTGCDSVGEEVYFENCGGGVRLLQRKKNLPQKKAEASSLGMTPIFARLKNHLQKIFKFGEKQTSNNSPETSSVHFSVVSDSATRWTAAYQASMSIINSWRLPKLMSIKTVIPSNCLIFCHPLILLPSFFPSISVFPNESVLCIRWPKDWSFSFSISSSNEYSGLISFRIHQFYLLAVQGTLRSLLQHHSSKA